MKIGKFFTNLLFNIKLFWHSLFYGMKVADEKTMGVTKDNNAVDDAIEEHVSEDSVYADLLKGELTQEVLELRDSNYRGYKGSFDYKYIGNGNVQKKNENMASSKLNVYNPENWNIALIQDNKIVVDGAYEVIISQDANEGGEIDNTNNKYYLKIERDVFPRFLIEKYVKKIVIRENNGELKIDLYCSTYARQFMPTDSLFITEMKNIFEKKIKPTDTVMIDSIEFITDGSYGAKDITLYVLGTPSFEGINMYDGNFVITYNKVVPICWGVDLTEKYRTEEMDKKYSEKAMRKNATLDFENAVAIKEEKMDTTQALNLLKEFNNQ